MASFSSSPASKGIVVTIPALVLILSATAVFLFLSLPFLSPSSCPAPSSLAAYTHNSGVIGADGRGSGGDWRGSEERVLTTREDVDWIKDQIRVNGLHMQENVLRKGINPRTRAQQLEDLKHYKGISHYEGEEADKHTVLPCPGGLLVEEHHSNYGEPWAGGRDVFEFLANASHLEPNNRVLEIGCGTLRVGLHFIRYLATKHYHCLERDELSLMAALRYELPSQGLLHKRPVIVKGEDMELSRFGSNVVYDLIYASAVFLHMPDTLVWVGVERLAGKLKPFEGRLFVSHNIKFCTRLGWDECTRRVASLGLEYIGKHTHDSLLFNHYEIWFEFKRTKVWSV